MGVSYSLQRRAKKGDLRLALKKGCPVLRRSQQKARREQQLLITGELHTLPDATGIHKGTASHPFIQKISSTVWQKLLEDGLCESNREGLKLKPELQRSDLGPDLNLLS